MAQPYVGEIRMFAGNFAPAGWAFCEGQLLAIAANETLFQLIGTTYGGDGQSTFALPDLRGRLPLHMGTGAGLSNRIMAAQGGTENVTLTVQQIPAHTHPPLCRAANGTQTGPGNGVWASSGLNQFSSGAANTAMNAQNIGAFGGSQPHENVMPYLAVSFIISLFGIFPPQG